mgnify:CR=1 FL=1|tara:strand:+ start:11201 stop:11416 length:216 start_codon:yes stop_codon:yes gene_type:complete
MSTEIGSVVSYIKHSHETEKQEMTITSYAGKGGKCVQLTMRENDENNLGFAYITLNREEISSLISKLIMCL